MEDFKVQSVLLTGGDRGIGLGLVEAFLGLPHPPQLLFATCRHPDGPGAQALKEMSRRGSKGCTLVVLQLDVTDPESIKAAAQKVGEQVGGSGLNLLINNAAIACDTTLETEDAQNMAAVYATNTIGPLLMCQAFMPLLRKGAWTSNQCKMSCKKAAIINISSSYGSLSLVDSWGWKQDVGYRCSKAALNMLTRCLALRYSICGILSVSLHPGGVKTDLGVEQEEVSLASSARGMVEVLSRLSAHDNGTFLDWKGQVIPW
ncbi:C-factor-like [Sceloporus undulatus]|uniref:C-factor-like n=1 Tax=Sceloporus undulatus TaxID=8520 RepID=UPI001C4BB3C6|nr:C-factor-like [Sceloporus undulatus]XP_042336632.1 C-factor-like [Sceloporus undulatus]XP_042336633.1 C-factor-like [Sceloporus undulatus]